MILVVLFAGAGIYFILMLLGLLHKNYMKQMNPPRREGLWIMSIGLLILAGYFGWYYYFMSTPQGKEIQMLQEQINQRAVVQPHR